MSFVIAIYFVVSPYLNFEKHLLKVTYISHNLI